MTPAELGGRGARMIAARSVLAAMSRELRVAAIAEVARRLCDREDPHGRALRQALAQSSGLSAANVELGITTTLGLFQVDALERLLATRRGPAARLPCAAVLAGNVWSAAARPLLLPLACGVPVMAKASAHDDALPRALSAALREVDARLGAACEVVTFDRERSDLLEALLQHKGVVSVFGDDETVASVGARVPAGTRLLAHGHGLGAACLGKDALDSPAASGALAEALALDVAAYDQRGCLSPHAVLIERGGAVEPRRFAVVLADALQALHARIPLGPLEAKRAVGADALQWLGVAAATGELSARQHAAVSFEADAPLRASPGMRHVAVLACDDLSAVRARLSPLGPQLKALGLAGSRAFGALADLAPYVCPVGQMQTPPLDATLDGLHPLEGYLD